MNRDRHRVESLIFEKIDNRRTDAGRINS